MAAGGLKPIVCVGESLEVRRAGDAEEYCRRQVRESLAGYSSWESLVVAYEPVWAIGTGQAASARDAQAIARAIRDELSNIAGQAHAGQIPVLYGGSVNPENAGPFVDRPDVRWRSGGRRKFAGRRFLGHRAGDGGSVCPMKGLSRLSDPRPRAVGPRLSRSRTALAARS